MDLTAVAAIGIIVMVVLLFMGMNIGIAMFFIGFGGYFVVRGWDSAIAILRTIPFTKASDYSFTVIPLFVLMGQFAFHSGLSEGLFGAADKWLGQFRGGLSMATIAACAGFAAICGSTAATAATMGVVALPEMRKYGYKDSLSTGSIAAGGTLGILIPPSTSFIIYGIVATQSIGRLFAAGIVPGILLALCYITAVVIQMKIKPDLAPGTVKYSWKVRFTSLKGTIGMVVLFLAVIGGMFAGIFTANEAAAMGAFLSMCFMIVMRKFTIRRFIQCLEETVRTSSMVMLILVGAYVMGAFLAITKMPMKLADFVTGLGLSPALILLCILILYVFLGCIMDSLAMVMLTVPIFLPIIEGLGFDLIWYGVLMTMVMETGLITPPVGMNVYVVAGVVKDVPLPTIFKGVFPFIVAIFICILIVALFPQLSLWLPNLIFGPA